MISSTIELDRETIASHYDELDRFYREIWGEHVHHGLWITGRESPDKAVLQLVDLIAEQAGIHSGMDVCDVGCGYGATARVLAQERGANVTAITISEAQYNFARSKDPASSNPRYLFGDWLENDLPPESFDAVIALESTEHMQDKGSFFTQAHRVLRPGGRCVVSAWLAREEASGLESKLLLEPVCTEGRMPTMGTASDYRQLYEREGFVFDSFQEVTKQVRRTWPICAWRFFLNLCRKPAYIKFLFNQHARNRIFALTMFRIWLAYNTGSMRYGVFTGHKP